MKANGSDSELIKIIRRGHESRDLDYKGPMLWNEREKRACCDIVKDVLAMANTSGGFIVIGVSEAPDGFVWQGIDDEQAASFDTSRLNRFLQEYADPPVNALLRKVREDEKLFIVIEVPHFPGTPHICQKDFPDVLKAMTLYVRTHNNESAPVRSAADFHVVIERAVRNRSDELLAAVRSILIGAPAPSEETKSSRDEFLEQRESTISRFSTLVPKALKELAFYYEVCFFPDVFARKRFPVTALRKGAQNAHVDFTGWPFLFIHANRPELTNVVEDGLETFVSDKYFDNYPLLDYWRFRESGLFFHRRLAPGEGKGEPVAYTASITQHSAEAIYCLTRLYDGLLEPEAPVSFMFRLIGTKGRRLTNLLPYAPIFGDYKAVIPEIQVEFRKTLAEWRAGIEDFAVECAREVFLRFNWENPNLETAKKRVRDLFARRW